MNEALILFGHGARDPEWARPLQQIQAQIVAADPARPVAVAFLEFMTPTLPEQVARFVADGVEEIAVVPMFIAQGGHLKRELPVMLDELARHYPALCLRLTPAIGEHPAVLAAMAGAARSL